MAPGFTIKSNARRAARKAGLDCDTLDFAQGTDGLWRWAAKAEALSKVGLGEENEFPSSGSGPALGDGDGDALKSTSVATGEACRATGANSHGRVPSSSNDGGWQPPETMPIGLRVEARTERGIKIGMCHVRGGVPHIAAGDDKLYPVLGWRPRLSIEDARARREAEKPPAAEPVDKTARLMAMLGRDGGVTIADITAAFGWLPHTARGRLSDLNRRAQKTIVAAESVEGRGRVYRLAPPEGAA